MRTDLGLMPLAALLGLGLACGSTSDGAGAPDARTEVGAGSAGMEGGSGGNSTGGSGGSISASGGLDGTAGTGGAAGNTERDGSATGGAPAADGAAGFDVLVPPEDSGVTFRLDADVGGCTPQPDSPFCAGDRPVTWYCPNFPVPDEFLSGPCMDAGTALIRYCCPCSFQDVCR